jgi:Fic family protein
MTIDYYNLWDYVPKGYPVRHRHRDPFPPPVIVPQGFTERARRIRTLDLELSRFVLSETDLQNLVIDAFTSNVHWSTKLEGNPLPEGEVRRITATTLTGKTKRKETNPGPRQEIINHVSSLVAPNEFKLPWEHVHIKALNAYLLRGTADDKERGSYKTEQNAIYTTSGTESFIPAPPKYVEQEMRTLLDWVNGPGRAFDSIVSATVFFHEFESIHPFMEGNGRTGRCLFHLLLQNSDLPNSYLCKIDKCLLEEGELYYQLLAYADESGSYTQLIDFISRALLKSYEAAYQTFKEKDRLELDEDSKRLFEIGKRHSDWFSLGEASHWVEGIGHQTIRNKLNYLTEIGALEKRGKTQSCRYRVKNPLSKVAGLAKTLHQATISLNGDNR